MNNLHISLTNAENESRLFKETKTLISNNIVEKIYIAGLWEEGLEQNQLLDKDRSIERVVLHTRKWPKNLTIQILKYLEFIFIVLWRYRNRKIGIVNIHGVALLPIGVLMKILFRAKLIYDTHEYETEIQGLKGVRKKFAKILESIGIKFCDRIIVVSNAIAKEYVRLYNIPKPAVVLNTPPYREIEKKDLFRERFGIAGECPIFLYQGGLSKGRGIEILIDAFKALHDEGGDTIPAIVFMGYGPLEEEIEEISKKYKNIYFHPAVSPDVLLEYTGSADFGISLIEDVCLSYRYSLPNKMFEYLMADLPVIVSDLPEMRQVIEENKVGVVVKENSPEGLEEAIEEVMGLDGEVLQKNIWAVKKIYNWEAQEKVLLGVYEGLKE